MRSESVTPTMTSARHHAEPVTETNIMRTKLGNSIDRILGFEQPINARSLIFVPGPLIAEARGKVGGIILSRNRGGPYIRSFATPINPQTPLQQSNRIVFASLVGKWNNTLTPAQRTGWNDFGEANPVPNTLGQDNLLSGQNWYIKANHTRLLAGVADEPDAPPSTESGVQDPLVRFDGIQSGTQTGDVEYDGNHAWTAIDDAALVIFVGKPQGLGVSRFKGPWRFALAVSGDTAIPETPPENNVPMPWNVVTGQQVWGKAVIVLPGLLSTNPFIFGPEIVTAA